MSDILSVTELSYRIKEGLEALFPYSISVRGEVSNFKLYPSGHAYFSLKDSHSILSAVLWSSVLLRLEASGKTLPKSGDQIIATGRITSYPGRGSYQLSLISFELDGLGKKLQELEELKKKLASEGLFDESRKKKIPSFPSRIAVIAGMGSAGFRDIEWNLKKRWPLIDIVFFPSLVQGKAAPGQIIQALENAEKTDCDTIILGRGGGSSEDLSAFNDEKVVRKVASCCKPTISAVGHEIDVTLTDFAADLRVSTPTAAAIAAVPDKEEVWHYLDEYSEKLRVSIEKRLRDSRMNLKLLDAKLEALNPFSILEKHKQELSNFDTQLNRLFGDKIRYLRSVVELKGSKVEAMNPEAVLNRGYSMTFDSKGNLIKTKSQVQPGSVLKTQFKDGDVVSVVK